jgi:RimJ/RimL family protein N-acetyltransferase
MISTPRLLLRALTLADVPKLFALSQEPALRRWIPDQVYADEAEATQVLRALISHTDRAASSWALTTLALPEVLGIVDASNAPSCRVLEKSGFTRTAEDVRADRTLLIYRRAAHAQPNGL